MLRCPLLVFQHIRIKCPCVLYMYLLYSKTGVYMGTHYFLIFALKQILWILVRTASINETVLTCTNNICFEQKYENSKKNRLKIVIFTAVKNRCILHGRVLVMIYEQDKTLALINKT